MRIGAQTYTTLRLVNQDVLRERDVKAWASDLRFEGFRGSE